MRDPPLLDPALLTPMPTDRQQQEADYRQVVLEHRARQTAESTQRKQTTWDLVVLGVAVVLAVVLILSVSRRRYRGNPRSLSEMAGSWFRGGIGSIRKQPPFVHDVSTNANRWTRYMLRVSISLAGVLAFVAVLDLPDAYDRLKEFTRGRPMDEAAMHEFIGSLPLPPEEKERLLSLEPGSYLGLAPTLARRHLRA